MTRAMIYGPGDVARLLNVSPSMVSNYIARKDDTPAPAFVTPDGRSFWDAVGMASWYRWHESLRDSGPDRWRNTTTRTSDAVDALRDTIKGAR